MTRNRIQFECPELLDARLRAYAEKTGLGVSEIIRAAVSDHLDRKDTAEVRSFRASAGITNFSVRGTDLIDAIRSNLRTLGLKSDAGSVAGWRTHSVYAQYEKGILGGKGGVVVTLNASGLPDALGRTTPAKNHVVWIEATPEDLPQPWSLSE